MKDEKVSMKWTALLFSIFPMGVMALDLPSICRHNEQNPHVMNIGTVEQVTIQKYKPGTMNGRQGCLHDGAPAAKTVLDEEVARVAAAYTHKEVVDEKKGFKTKIIFQTEEKRTDVGCKDLRTITKYKILAAAKDEYKNCAALDYCSLGHPAFLDRVTVPTLKKQAEALNCPKAFEGVQTLSSAKNNSCEKSARETKIYEFLTTGSGQKIMWLPIPESAVTQFNKVTTLKDFLSNEVARRIYNQEVDSIKKKCVTVAKSNIECDYEVASSEVLVNKREEGYTATISYNTQAKRIVQKPTDKNINESVCKAYMDCLLEGTDGTSSGFANNFQYELCEPLKTKPATP